MDKRIRIGDAHEAAQVPIVRELFREYANWLQVDLCFQGFEAELATLPGKYAPPQGAILLACIDEAIAGCVAMRPLEPSVCEMKRLWVREGFRGTGLGRRLVESIIGRARASGYRFMRLDTLPVMQDAVALYRRLGFYDIAPYYQTPWSGSIYLEKRLDV